MRKAITLLALSSLLCCGAEEPSPSEDDLFEMCGEEVDVYASFVDQEGNPITLSRLSVGDREIEKDDSLPEGVYVIPDIVMCEEYFVTVSADGHIGWAAPYVQFFRPSVEIALRKE